MKRRLFIPGILLAAGESQRFASTKPKQLIDIEGEALVHRVARQALESRLDELIVVLGHEFEAVRAVLSDLDVMIVRNTRHTSGQSSSIKVALPAIRSRASAAVFLVADQPFLTPVVINKLIQAYQETGASIVLPAHKNRRGSPVLFDRALFPELDLISGDEGGRQILDRHAGEIVTVELPSERPLADIDTLEDYQRLARTKP